MKRYIYLVMMNHDPMGGVPEWHAQVAFDNRKDAKAYIDEMWNEQWRGQDGDTYTAPIDKDEWLRIEKVEFK